MSDNNKIVSFDNEKLIVVDQDDNILDYKTKAECHAGKGILHRAFSIFIFSQKMQLLIQKRSASKQLWPYYWSNSCCSHPRKGETMADAAGRRLSEELGISTSLKYLYKFQYHAEYENKGSENEICSVFIGKGNDHISVNPNEIAEWKFVDLDELGKDMEANQSSYTPWFLMEWEQIRKHYLKDVKAL
jgi:isopentenyl-diphosphate delta-isomerase